MQQVVLVARWVRLQSKVRVARCLRHSAQEAHCMGTGICGNFVTAIGYSKILVMSMVLVLKLRKKLNVVEKSRECLDYALTMSWKTQWTHLLLWYQQFAHRCRLVCLKVRIWERFIKRSYRTATSQDLPIGLGACKVGIAVNASQRDSEMSLKQALGGLSKACNMPCASQIYNQKFLDWKRRHAIDLDQRVFIITGWYPCIKEALVARGWVQNLDQNSPFFDLKWTLASQQLRWAHVHPWQCTNHFHDTRSLVTKAGLSQAWFHLCGVHTRNPARFFQNATT
mmetsp:Transcript_4917/g.15442  ORF Transcript_4917/g.15442 Transcript_4917/m.15442 type:complete len:282 (-) Transcript_4917:2252-3097(-)